MLAGIATADDLSARACTSIADKMARLACYDAALGVTAPVPQSATSGAAPSAPQIATAVAPASAGKSPESAFGDTGNLIGSQKPELPKRLTATVVRALPLGQGLYRLTLDNGQIWQTMQADWAVDFDSGYSVTISHMMFDSYLISRTGHGRTVSVKRIQ